MFTFERYHTIKTVGKLRLFRSVNSCNRYVIERVGDKYEYTITSYKSLKLAEKRFAKLIAQGKDK